MAAVLGRQPTAAGGWDESSVTSGIIHVPTAVFYPAPLRRKPCARLPRPGCHAGLGPNAHSYVVYRYAGSEYPRYYHRWRGYGWNR